MTAKYWYLLLVTIVVTLSCNDKEMIIEELIIDTSKGNYTWNDTINRRENKIFIVDHFCYCERDERIIDSLVCALIEDKSYSYGFGIFKKSRNTNVEHLTQFPRNFDRYSRQDLLMGISYEPKRKGEIVVRQKYKDEIFNITKVFQCEIDSIRYITDSKLLN